MKKVSEKEIVADKNLISYCGLYCDSCRGYLAGKCPGCRDNIKAKWCKTRSCCIGSDVQSCAHCSTTDFRTCKKCINIISRMFGYIFNSDREKCLNRIKEIGYDAYATEMSANKMQTIRRK